MQNELSSTSSNAGEVVDGACVVDCRAYCVSTTGFEYQNDLDRHKPSVDSGAPIEVVKIMSR